MAKVTEGGWLPDDVPTPFDGPFVMSVPESLLRGRKRSAKLDSAAATPSEPETPSGTPTTKSSAEPDLRAAPPPPGE